MTDPGADDDVLDLTAIAAAHPIRRVRLDIARIMADGLLSVGDVVDMAEKLGTEPSQLGKILDGTGGESVAIDVGIALAWIIGRKADPALSYDEVRTSWRIEPGAAATPDPTPPTPRKRARCTSSA